MTSLTIAQRELASYFRTSVGWAVVALFLLLTGVWISFETIRPGQPATMRVFFGISQWLLLMVAPAVSMRLFSEEIRTGTIEPLMTAPIHDWQIVVGKYLGAVGFLIAMLLPTLLHVGLLELVADPDYGPIAAGYAGLLLVGMLYLAAGLLASALTANQIVAFLAPLFFFLLLWFIASQGAPYVGPPWDRVLYSLSIPLRIADFAKGVIDSGHAVFFLASSAWFVVLAAVAVESRRWR